MEILENYNLKNFNTFGINSIANRFVRLKTEEDIQTYFSSYPESEYLILGGGSNVLLPDYIQKDVLHIELKGKEIINEDQNSILIGISGGENWHEFVKFTVEKNYYGFENLALIPGNVGTAPIQNIGAYGVEQDQFFNHLKGYDIESKSFVSLSKDECKFNYRDSIFKNELKGKFIITNVVYSLPLNFIPNLTYKELNSYIKNNNLDINQKNIFESVIKIRQNKLPDPKHLGNSGSFFKNPVITGNKFTSLKSEFPDLNGYEVENGIKISAGWLIEKAGFKGIRKNDSGVYSKHALILVNYGNATSSEIQDLAFSIIEKVESIFNIKLKPEVNIYS